MREVIIPYSLWRKIEDIRDYLIFELKLSEKAAGTRINRMEAFINSLKNPADYVLCRFKRWRVHGYRCAVFENSWIFAYEIFDRGVIVRDIAHVSSLTE